MACAERTKPRSVRELKPAIAATQLGAKPKVRALPRAVVWTAGVFNPLMKELRETQHQFRKPFILDSSAAEKTFGLAPASIEDLGRARPRPKATRRSDPRVTDDCRCSGAAVVEAVADRSPAYLDRLQRQRILLRVQAAHTT